MLYGSVLSDAYGTLGASVPVLLICMLCASLLEGMGLTLLVPLLGRIGIGDGTADSNPILQFVDPILEAASVPYEVGPLMVIVVFVLLLQVAMTFAVACFLVRCTTRYTAHWRDKLFGAVTHADWTFLMRTKAETQVNQIVNESSRVSAAFSLLLQMFNSLFFVLVYAVIAFIASWQVVAMLLAFGLAIYLITRPLSRRGRRVGERVTEVSQALIHRAQEFLSGAKLIKATATEAAAMGLFSDAV
ncbi:MAG: ABC transporter ATP-binding protein, partial [Lysobacterales bacterium]